jgi:hypothetical protein
LTSRGSPPFSAGDQPPPDPSSLGLTTTTSIGGGAGAFSVFVSITLPARLMNWNVIACLFAWTSIAPTSAAYRTWLPATGVVKVCFAAPPRPLIMYVSPPVSIRSYTWA